MGVPCLRRAGVSRDMSRVPTTVWLARLHGLDTVAQSEHRPARAARSRDRVRHTIRDLSGGVGPAPVHSAREVHGLT